MIEPKFTKGPWSIIGGTMRQESLDWHVVRAGERQQLVAKVLELDSDANAHLICAAPKLYEALVGVIRVADRKTDEFDAARAALAEARGETA